MQYYLNLFEEIKASVIMMGKYVPMYGEKPFISCYRFILVFGFSVFFLIRIVMIAVEKKDTAVGTLSFWMVLSLLTFGIGGVVLLIIDLFTDDRVAARPFNSFIYLVLPTAVTFGLSYANMKGWTDWRLDNSLLLFVGVITVFVEIFIVTVSQSNKRVMLILKEGRDSICDARILATKDKLIRKAYRENSDGTVTTRVRNENVSYNLISEKQLERYLLVSEKRDRMLIRQFKKSSDDTFNVLEFDSLVMPKICACLTGMMILMALTTPYIPYMLNCLMKLCDRR